MYVPTDSETLLVSGLLLLVNFQSVRSISTHMFINTDYHSLVSSHSFFHFQAVGLLWKVVYYF